MPNCRHSLRRFTPSCLASITNSRRWSMTDTSRHGMARPLVRRIKPILRCQPCLRTGVSYLPGLNSSEEIHLFFFAEAWIPSPQALLAMTWIGLPLPRQPDALHGCRQIVEAVHDDRQPGRVG